MLDLYRDAGLGQPSRVKLIRPDLSIEEPDFAQVATTIPPWPHPPADRTSTGSPPLARGRPVPGTFSMLAGLPGSPITNNPTGATSYVWPGTHLRLGAYLAELRRRGPLPASSERIHPAGPPEHRPSVPPSRFRGGPGSVLFAHYLLGHNIGGHSGTAGDERRETIYYRLHATGHRERWREVVTSPLTEFLG